LNLDTGNICVCDKFVFANLKQRIIKVVLRELFLPKDGLAVEFTPHFEELMPKNPDIIYLF